MKEEEKVGCADSLHKKYFNTLGDFFFFFFSISNPYVVTESIKKKKQSGDYDEQTIFLQTLVVKN